MPTLNLFTNIPVDIVVASDILRYSTKAVAKIIGKPESKFFKLSYTLTVPASISSFDVQRPFFGFNGSTF
ncbi:hypothetical protein GmHk_17G047988 [Glycine max]|nr:hypothetical protein GmHk_17G047988 [Glycine max]